MTTVHLRRGVNESLTLINLGFYNLGGLIAGEHNATCMDGAVGTGFWK